VDEVKGKVEVEGRKGGEEVGDGVKEVLADGEKEGEGVKEGEGQKEGELLGGVVNEGEGE